MSHGQSRRCFRLPWLLALAPLAALAPNPVSAFNITLETFSCSAMSWTLEVTQFEKTNAASVGFFVSRAGDGLLYYKETPLRQLNWDATGLTTSVVSTFGNSLTGIVSKSKPIGAFLVPYANSVQATPDNLYFLDDPSNSTSYARYYQDQIVNCPNGATATSASSSSSTTQSSTSSSTTTPASPTVAQTSASSTSPAQTTSTLFGSGNATAAASAGQQKSSSGTNVGAVAGAIASSIAATAIAAIAVFLLCRRKRRANSFVAGAGGGAAWGKDDDHRLRQEVDGWRDPGSGVLGGSFAVSARMPDVASRPMSVPVGAGAEDAYIGAAAAAQHPSGYPHSASSLPSMLYDMRHLTAQAQSPSQSLASYPVNMNVSPPGFPYAGPVPYQPGMMHQPQQQQLQADPFATPHVQIDMPHAPAFGTALQQERPFSEKEGYNVASADFDTNFNVPHDDPAPPYRSASMRSVASAMRGAAGTATAAAGAGASAGQSTRGAYPPRVRAASACRSGGRSGRAQGSGFDNGTGLTSPFPGGQQAARRASGDGSRPSSASGPGAGNMRMRKDSNTSLHSNASERSYSVMRKPVPRITSDELNELEQSAAAASGTAGAPRLGSGLDLSPGLETVLRLGTFANSVPATEQGQQSQSQPHSRALPVPSKSPSASQRSSLPGATPGRLEGACGGLI